MTKPRSKPTRSLPRFTARLAARFKARCAARLAPAILAAAVTSVCLPALAQNAAAPPTTRPSAVAPELAGRTVEEVRVIGKTKPLGSTTISEILHQVRTREGAKFDPSTVEADYQRVYGLKKFSNVEARVEPTNTGVIVVFEITEQPLIREIRFRGNEKVQTKTLQDAINIQAGEAIDSFRLGLAREAIERYYQSKNFTYVHVDVDQTELARTGIVTFNVVEGPHVRVRKVRVLGNKTFTNGRVRDEIKTKSWFPFFVGGKFSPEQLEADVAAVRKFYEDRGFFDVRVSRTVTVSPTTNEVMVNFVIEEGPRYKVGQILFEGNQALDADALKKNMKLVEGEPYNAEVIQRDTREIIRAYGPFGFIHLPNDPNPDPDYMRIREQRVFKRDAGTVDVIYQITEGKPFEVGRVIVKGNGKTQDKVVLREVRLIPGQLYNSDEITRANDRLRATNLFQTVTITPIPPSDPVAGDAPLPDDGPAVRDLLIEVAETQTARFLIGAGVTSNSGILGNITYEQRNFDINNPPSGLDEWFSSRAWTGAGQTFRVSLEPGTELSRARVDFVEPWLFDQPYSLGLSAYLSQRLRRDWTETRIGGRASLGKRFSDEWSARVNIRGEDVEISDIDDEELRAREVLDLEGHTTIDGIGLEVTRNTTNSSIFPTQGTITSLGYEHVGALSNEFDFDKFTAGFNYYTTVYEDLLDRKTVLSFRLDAGYISGETPFFERFYGGGIGNVRGFRFRGISPRSGIDDDPIGGDFSLTGSTELNYPIAGDVLRGVFFVDAGTVEEDLEIGTIRSSVGFGFRLTLPFFGQLPMALDFGFPVTKDDEDDTRLFSFSLGLTQ